MSETVYFEQIKKLIDLQKVDDEIFLVKQNMENTPRNLDELKQKFNIIENRRNRIQDKLDHLIEQSKRLAIEIDDDSAKIKKSKNKMMQVGNTREYHAMLREMDSMEKINHTREEEKMTLLEELRSQKAAMEEIDKEYNEIKSELETKSANLNSTLEADKEKLDNLAKERKIFSAGIPKPIFMRYEFIRKRLEHPVIVAVDEGICTGCHIAIPPQSFIELQTGQQILSCPNCQRLIFWSNHFEDPTVKKDEDKKTIKDKDIEIENEIEEETEE